MKGIGIDMAPVARMEAALVQQQFMDNTFSKLEQEYCNSYKNAAVHFAGTFAAKEAVRKATGNYPILKNVEIRRTQDGKPEVWIGGKLEASLLLSITHTETDACAVALAQ
ncbi:MAG: 4'-phosphopantetheinyl transferase superfamily protein [Candidatus Adlerbacteria bacterium]